MKKLPENEFERKLEGNIFKIRIVVISSIAFIILVICAMSLNRVEAAEAHSILITDQLRTRLTRNLP